MNICLYSFLKSGGRRTDSKSKGNVAQKKKKIENYIPLKESPCELEIQKSVQCWIHRGRNAKPMRRSCDCEHLTHLSL